MNKYKILIPWFEGNDLIIEDFKADGGFEEKLYQGISLVGEKTLL